MNNKILIVGNADGYFELLSNSNDKCNVFTLANVNHLPAFLLKQAVDLVLLIIEDNFFEEVSIVESVKNNESYKDIPVIVVDKSPYPIPNNIKLAFQSGITEYLKGGTDDIELLSRVDNQLKSSKRMAEVVEENSVNKETLQLMDRLILFMDRADNSFVIFGAEGEIEWVNDGFNRLYGYSIDEFKRKFGRTVYQASKNSEINIKVDKCVKTKKSINYVAECQTRSGEFKWIQTTFTPIVSPTGKIERFIAIETDITKLKETEEALNQKNEYMMALTNHLKSANTLLEEQQREINQQNKAIEEERKKSEDLLLNILPFEVARQLKSKGEAKPRNYKFTTVLFLDFRNFTQLTQELSPTDLVQNLDSYFTHFDEIVEKHFVEKIKTIGDAYMCVGGLPLRNRSNPFNIVLAGLEMQQIINDLVEETKTPEGLDWRCRIGIHTGPVMAGVVGKKKYIYDIWGNTVNIAARMQQESEVGMVNISGKTYEEIKDYFDCTYRGKIAMKNSNEADMYFVIRLKPEYSADEMGLLPNEAFLKMLNSL
ncbi:MAG: PAS domain-containing protein [Salinivirgaceae bacterium]|nr:PAS domain-containing protein [Salinivirgaceae bacterium]